MNKKRQWSLLEKFVATMIIILVLVVCIPSLIYREYSKLERRRKLWQR